MASTSQRLAPLILLVLLLGAELAPVAHAGQGGGGDYVEQLAKDFRSLLAQYSLGVIGYEEAAGYILGLANCSTKEAGFFNYVSSVLASNTSLEEKRRVLGDLLDVLAKTPPPRCPSSLLYHVYLVAAMDPTPLGLGVVDPARSIQRLAAILANVLHYSGASRLVEEIVFTYYPERIAQGMDAYTAIHGMALTAALAGDPDKEYWSRVLLLDPAGIELIAALSNPFELGQELARRLLAVLAPGYTPSEPEQLLLLLNESIASNDYVRAAALIAASTAAYRARAMLLDRIVQGGIARIPVGGLGALSPSILGYIASHHSVPVKLASRGGEEVVAPLGLALGVQRGQLLGALKDLLPGAGVSGKLYHDLRGAGFNPVNWSIIGGEASALILSAPGYVTYSILFLFLDPFTPMDPWILGLAGRGMPGAGEALSTLSSRGVEALVDYALKVAHPWPGVMAIAALNAYEEGLLARVNSSDAALIARRAGLEPGSDPFYYAIPSVAYREALGAAARTSGEGLVEWLGYYTRYASIRPLGGGLVIDYAYARGLASLLVEEVPAIQRALEEAMNTSPALAYWALGIVETTSPVDTSIIVREGLRGLEEAAARLRGAAGSPAYANASAELSKTAEEVERIASSVETGQLPQAIVLAKRLHSVLESGGREAQLLRRALGDQGVAELVKSLERVETLGGREAAEVAAAAKTLEEVAGELEKQGAHGLAEKMRGLGKALVEGNVSEARELARKIASAKNPPGAARPITTVLGRLFEEKPSPGITDIAEAVLGATRQGSQASGAGNRGLDVTGLLKLIREGRLEEAAKQLENMTKSNPGEAARALQELSKSGVNVTSILSYLSPETMNRLVHSVLSAKEKGAGAVTAAPGAKGRVEEATGPKRAAETPRAPRIGAPRLEEASQPWLAALLVAALAVSALLFWASSRPERILILGRVARPIASRLNRRSVEKEGAPGLRGLVVEEFARLLQAASILYGPRRPSETHREYLARLPRGEREALVEAAEAYEEAKFSSHPVTREHLERVRRALRRLARRG